MKLFNLITIHICKEKSNDGVNDTWILVLKFQLLKGFLLAVLLIGAGETPPCMFAAFNFPEQLPNNRSLLANFHNALN